LQCLQDAARDLAEDGDEQHSDEEYSSTWLRRASASSRGDGCPSGGNSPVNPPEEVARFGVAKERKGLRSAGIAAFNRSACRPCCMAMSQCLLAADSSLHSFAYAT
jgi:hypothetical protein